MSRAFRLHVPVFACFPHAPPRSARKKIIFLRYEADKIRDAETTNDRMKLFVSFAEDRLTKFKYELEHPSLHTTSRHAQLPDELLYRLH